MKKKQFDRAGWGAFATLIGGMATVLALGTHNSPIVPGALLLWGLWMYLPTRWQKP